MTASLTNPEFIKGKWRVHHCGAILGDQIHGADGKLICTVCGEPAVGSVISTHLSRSEQDVVDFFKANPGMPTRDIVRLLGRPYSTISNTLVKARKLGLIERAQR